MNSCNDSDSGQESNDIRAEFLEHNKIEITEVKNHIIQIISKVTRKETSERDRIPKINMTKSKSHIV